MEVAVFLALGDWGLVVLASAGLVALASFFSSFGASFATALAKRDLRRAAFFL